MVIELRSGTLWCPNCMILSTSSTEKVLLKRSCLLVSSLLISSLLFSCQFHFLRWRKPSNHQLEREKVNPETNHNHNNNHETLTLTRSLTPNPKPWVSPSPSHVSSQITSWIAKRSTLTLTIITTITIRFGPFLSPFSLSFSHLSHLWLILIRLSLYPYPNPNHNHSCYPRPFASWRRV